MDAAKKYEYIKTLGEGSYGHVWLCRDRERDCLVAIKKFKDANKDSQAYHLAMREIKLLRATSHEHVVSVIEAFRSQSSGNVYLVMEYAESCLNLDLKKHRTGLPSMDVMRITWQLTSALQYLHSRKIVHRDLKPANILLTAAGDLKLCDFGFARDLPSAGQQADMSSYVTTRWYRAPEVVVGAEYGASVDIWALGCLFAELLNGQPLFPGASNMDQLALIVACFGHLPNRLLAKALTNPQLVGVQLRTGNPRNWAVALQQRFAPYGENAVTLLLSCLNPDPLKRVTADEVLRAPYFEPIRQKRVPSLNGPPSIAITATTAVPANAASALPPAPAMSAGPVHPAAAIPPPAVAATAALAAAASNAAAVTCVGAAAAGSKTQLQQPQQPPVSQPQQQPSTVTPSSTDGAQRTWKETELQPERTATVATVHAVPAIGTYAATAAEGAGSEPVPAPTGAGSSGAQELQAARPGPVHPALAVPRQAPAEEPSAKEAEQEAGVAASGPGARGVDVEVDTLPAALAQSFASQPQRQTSQVRFLPQTLPSFGHGGQSQAQVLSQVEPAGLPVGARQGPAPAAGSATGVAQETSSCGESARHLQQQLQQQRDARVPASFQQMRASMAAIPMSAVPMGAARPLTDTGMGIPGIMQTPAPMAQGKAGATLVQHNKRASEHSIGVYGNHRGTGGTSGISDISMRLARVSLVNPNIDVSQLAPENASASSSPSTTPTGAAVAAAVATAAAAAGAAAGSSGNLSLISPSSSLSAGGAPPLANGFGGITPYVPGPGRRRSTATGSRLTRVSHTCEGQDPQQRDEDSEDERNSDQLSLTASHGGAPNAPASLAPVGVVVGSGLQPSPRRWHSRLASVTEPGGQLPPGATTAAGTAAAASAAAAAAAPSSIIDAGGFDHPGGASRGPSAPQMLSPLGRNTHLLTHHGVNVISAGSGSGAGPNPGSVLLMSDSGHHGAAHGMLHATMSAMSLNVMGIGMAARERERESHAEAGGTLRSNAMVGIAAPAAPTASQRSFTSQSATTSAAAAGLMSRPVSNLYINLENGANSRMAPQEVAEGSSAEISAAVSPSAPTGAAMAPSAAAAAAATAAPMNRRTTFTDGPSSMFKSVLRTLSTRRSTTNSHSGMVAEQSGAAAASAAASASAAAAAAAAATAHTPGLQPTNSIGGVPPSHSHGSLNVPCGVMHSQSSASSSGTSPFIPSRASSHNFIANVPAERMPGEASGSLSIPGGADDYGAAAAAALRRSVTVTHGVSGVGAGVGGAARIGLPHLNVRIPETISGGPATVANGYGSAVVSPAGRRRSQLEAGMMMGSAVLRQASSGSVGMPGGHQGCKPTSSMHSEMAGVPGIMGGGAAGLPVVRNPAPPSEGPSVRLAPGKGARDLA